MVGTPERSLEDEVEYLECRLDVHKEFFAIYGRESSWSEVEVELTATLGKLKQCPTEKRPQR